MSLTKATAKDLRGLSRKKHREEEGKFIIEGLRLAREAAESDFAVLEVLHTADVVNDPAGRSVLQLLRGKTDSIRQVTRREIEAVSDTVHAQGIVAVLRQKRYPAESLIAAPGGRVTLAAFDGVSDPGNLGSMIRTCDWFGLGGVLLGRNSVELYNPKVVRATMGGVFHLRVADDVDLLSAVTKAKEAGYSVYVADTSGEVHIDRVRFAEKTMVVFGNEAWGVSDRLKECADVRVAIRRYGAAESLNVAVACGIFLAGIHRVNDE